MRSGSVSGMQTPPSVFSQITAVLYPAEFSRCVELFPTDRPTRGLTCYDQFLALCFGQLTFRESLREIVACLKSKGSSLYHLGFRGNISRTQSSLTPKSTSRLAYVSSGRSDPHAASGSALSRSTDGSRFSQNRFRFGSSIISLSLNLFPLGLLRAVYASSSQAAYAAVFTGQFAWSGR